MSAFHTLAEVQNEKTRRVQQIMKPFYKIKRGHQQRWKRGGNDGCRETNRATFSVFAWHCCPCQLLNASVSQASVQLATVLLLHSGRHPHCRSSIHLPCTYNHKYSHSGMPSQPCSIDWHSIHWWKLLAGKQHIATEV